MIAFAISLLFLMAMSCHGFSTQPQDPLQNFPAAVNRDCAPWDGGAFTISIQNDSDSLLNISIWQSPDIKLPSTFSFPDKTGQIGNVSLTSDGYSEQLIGKVWLSGVEQGIPIEGEFHLSSNDDRQFNGKFVAEWGNEIVFCG
jgi:hypothetical protein